MPFLFLVLLFTQTAGAVSGDPAKKKEDIVPEKLSVYQQQIKKCLPQLKKFSDYKTMSQIYDVINSKFLLVSENTLYRELFYRSLSSQGQLGQSEDRKLKVTDNKIELLRIEKDEKVTPIDIDARQLNGPVEAQIKQLTLNAKIEKDWGKTRQVREGGLVLEVVRIDNKINQLQVSSEKTKLKLDCQMVNSSEVCLCSKL